ncbi:MAG: hypothetical protein COA78_17000 [Blastopirellula sp.]|nr:MAG: hypothetical protein COA78_17000 [Blastopirellula sp.]
MNEPDNPEKSTTPQSRGVVREPKGDLSNDDLMVSWLENTALAFSQFVCLFFCVVFPIVSIYNVKIAFRLQLGMPWILLLIASVPAGFLFWYGLAVVFARVRKLADIPKRGKETLPTSQQAAAVTEIKKLGGKVELNESSEVIQVILSQTQVTDAGLVHLKGLNSLISLGLNDTQITDAGLEHLKGLTSLNRLYLCGTQVTDEGLVHLNGLTSLNDLHLRSTQITDAGLSELKAALPKCRIIKYHFLDGRHHY